MKNLGKVDKSGSLSIQSEGRILVTYNSNDTCQGAVKYSTSIYLNCLRGAIVRVMLGLSVRVLKFVLILFNTVRITACFFMADDQSCVR